MKNKNPISIRMNPPHMMLLISSSKRMPLCITFRTGVIIKPTRMPCKIKSHFVLTQNNCVACVGKRVNEDSITSK